MHNRIFSIAHMYVFVRVHGTTIKEEFGFCHCTIITQNQIHVSMIGRVLEEYQYKNFMYESVMPKSQNLTFFDRNNAECIFSRYWSIFCFYYQYLVSSMKDFSSDPHFRTDGLLSQRYMLVSTTAACK